MSGEVSDSYVKQPTLRRPDLVRHRARLSFHSLRHLEQVRGGAGRRGSGGPTGLDISRHRGDPDWWCRKSAGSFSVPRAVFEACSVRPPVVGLFQDPSRCGALPRGLNHRSGTSMRPARWQRGYGRTAKNPAVAKLSLRDLTAWAAWAGCTFGTPHFAFPGHRSPVPLNNVSRTPSGGPACAGI